jgi:hypothetical protein
MSDFIKTLMGFLEDTDKPKMGPWQRTSPEMKRLHQEHKDIVEQLWPAFRAAEREYRKQKQTIADEQERWGDQMRALTPELNDVTHIEISEDGEKFRVTLDNEVKIDQPDWAKSLEQQFRKEH